MTRVRCFGAIAALALLVGTGCSPDEFAVPKCRADSRLGLIAQSVPGAAYVPCIEQLPAGWQFESLHIDDDETRFQLRSDRDDHPVRVALVDTCDFTGAVPIEPRANGARTFQRTESIAPRYSGELYDVFPGGCVTYKFDFRRGPHIALIDEFEQAVQLYSRLELRQQLHKKLGITLDSE